MPFVRGVCAWVWISAFAIAFSHERISIVSTGFDHGCSLHVETGTVRCWGAEEFNMGQSVVPDGLGFVEDISAGGLHSCAVRFDDGKVICWGDNYYNQSRVPEELGPAIAVAAGLDHTCAIRGIDFRVHCWGSNLKGNRSMPPVDLYRVAAVSAGGGGPFGHSCAIVDDASETVRCWGSNSHGQTKVPAGLGAVVSVSAGGVRTCAVRKADAAVRCWGFEDETASMLPADLGPALSVSVGYAHSCVVRKNDSHVTCWGIFGYYTPFVPRDLGPVTAVSAGGKGQTCAVQKMAGQVRCWGGRHVVGEVSMLAAPGSSRTKCERGLAYSCLGHNPRERAHRLANKRIDPDIGGLILEDDV